MILFNSVTLLRRLSEYKGMRSGERLIYREYRIVVSDKFLMNLDVAKDVEHMIEVLLISRVSV